MAAMSADPRITTWEERQLLVERLAQVDPGLLRGLEAEIVDPYETTLAGFGALGASVTYQRSAPFSTTRKVKPSKERNRFSRDSHSSYRSPCFQRDDAQHQTSFIGH
jgi:hypothetical protein